MPRLIPVSLLALLLIASAATAADGAPGGAVPMAASPSVAHDATAWAAALGTPGKVRPVMSLSAGDEAPASDWDGLKRDTLYFGFTQLAVIGALYISPQSISGWSSETKDDYSFAKYRRNIRKVVWDTDDWWINYVLHPYWGGTYFVRAAERGYGNVPAFWYSFFLSAMYEFGAEALFEKPSIQDLIFTPGLGYFVGRYFMKVRDGIRLRALGGQRLSGIDRTKLFLTDPLGSVNRGVNRLLGRDLEISVRPIVTMPVTSGASRDLAAVPSDVPTSPGQIAPGLHLRLTW